jgi:predicted Zn-dependent protease
MNKGDAAAAFTTLKPLADKPNAPPQVQTIACRLASNEKVNDPDAGRCDRALKASGDVDTANAAIRFALKVKNEPALKKAFGEAKTRLDKAKAGGAEIDELAVLAQGTGRWSLAEDALAKSAAPNAGELKKKIDVDRKRQGIPRGLLTADNEAELIERMKIIAADDDAHKGDDVDNALHKFGEVPALYIEKCDWQIQKERLRDAEQTCEKAVKLYPDSTMAQLVTGIAYASDELPSKAIPYLEKALALDPDLPGVYEALAPVYHTIGKRDLEKKLGDTYQAKFGKPIPKPPAE